MQETPALLIAAIRRRLKQTVGAQVREHGLSVTQFWVLIRIFEGEGMSLRELAEALYMDQPTASRVVSALTKQRLVRVDDDPGDRRRGRIVLSARGRALGQRLHGHAVNARAAVEAGLSADERAILRDLLQKALTYMETTS